MEIFMRHQMLLPTMAALLLTACSSTSDTDPGDGNKQPAAKPITLTSTAGVLKSDDIDLGFDEKTATTVDFPDAQSVAYRGVAGITPEFADGTAQSALYVLTGDAAIDLDFTNADAEGVLSGNITNLREERLNAAGIALAEKDVTIDLSGKTTQEINALYEVVNEFTGDITITGESLRSGDILAEFDATLTPTQGDTTATVRIQDAVYGSVYNAGDAGNKMMLSSAITIDQEQTPPEVFTGSMISDNATYNHDKISTVIIATETTE